MNGQVYDEGRTTVETRYVLQHGKDRSTTERKMKKKYVPYALHGSIVEDMRCKKK